MSVYVRKVLTPLEKFTLGAEAIPGDIDSAYNLVRAAIEGNPDFGAAWKLGGTTFVTRKIFNVDKLYFGPLHTSEVFAGSTLIPGRPLLELKGEGEIALRVASGAGIEGYLDGVTQSSYAELFDAWCVALEMPSSPITNLDVAGVSALVADRCASGALVLGAARRYDVNTRWTDAKLHIEQDGIVVAVGGTDSLVAPPDVCAWEFLVEAARAGFTVKPGAWISTGGLTPCVPLRVGSKVGVFLNGIAALSFVAATASP